MFWMWALILLYDLLIVKPPQKCIYKTIQVCKEICIHDALIDGVFEVYIYMQYLYMLKTLSQHNTSVKFGVYVYDIHIIKMLCMYILLMMYDA